MKSCARAANDRNVQQSLAMSRASNSFPFHQLWPSPSGFGNLALTSPPSLFLEALKILCSPGPKAIAVPPSLTVIQDDSCIIGREPTIRKNAVAAEYSTSSEAVKRMSKFSEKSPEDIESGVVPEKERFSESNLSHEYCRRRKHSMRY